MKKIFFLLLPLLLCTPIFSMVEKSPWIIINNKTPLSFTGQIVITYYYTNYDNKEITIDTKDYENIQIVYQQDTDEHEKNCILFFLNIECPAESIIELDSIFTLDNKIFCPLIHSATFTQQSLQLTILTNSIDNNDCYFSIEYEPYYGISATAKPISLYTQCMHHSKKIIEKTILAATYLKNLCTSYINYKM